MDPVGLILNNQLSSSAVPCVQMLMLMKRYVYVLLQEDRCRSRHEQRPSHVSPANDQNEEMF